MKKPLRHKIYWWGALAVYLLAVTTVFCLLFDVSHLWFDPEEKDPLLFSPGKESSPRDLVAQFEGFSGILLPLGPGDGRLPGFTAIWNESPHESDVGAERRTADGFDGLQAVADLAELSKGSVAELFLSGTPAQVFLRGTFLLLLNSQGVVQVIDCHNPRDPKMLGLLPYQQVKSMEMQGNLAYLHLSNPGGRHEKLVVADLSNPLKPQEIIRLNLPKETVSFLLWGRQLIVYTSTRGYEGEHLIHLYDFTDSYQLLHLGSVKSSLLSKGFLKHGDYLLVPDSLAGLHVCDFSNPLQPVVVASLALPDRVRLFAERDDVVFVQGGLNRMYAIDLHDPVLPVLTAVVEQANHPAFYLNVGRYTYYFTQKGYLQVFDGLPSIFMGTDEPRPTGVTGELVGNQDAGGFTLLGNSRDPLPAVVTDVLTLPGQSAVADTLFWQGDLIVLGEDGLVQFFRNPKERSLEFQESLQLPPGQRWLTAGKDRLYIGGESGVSVIAQSDDGHFILTGQFELPGKESWDGLVVEKTLCIAAGKEGVWCFSLEHQDQPIARPGWAIPPQLEPLVDVRQLAAPGEDRVLAAAGLAGLISARIDDGSQLLFEGALAFSAPTYALAVVADFCLVSTGTGIYVVDTRTSGSVQNLGKIDFSGVERFAVAAPDVWAGYVPGAGWFTLPVPRLAAPGDVEILDPAESKTLSGARHGLYRLNLFNDREVVTVPGVFSLPFAADSRGAGAANGL